MFNLENEIAQWRQSLIACGIKKSQILDELEAHLREDVAQQISAGADAQRAFEIAIERIGEPKRIKAEFAKTAEGSLLWRLKIWLSRLRGYADTMPDIASFTPDGQRTLSFAREEAPRLHHDFIGTEHVLLGLTQLPGDIVPKMLQRMGVDSANVRREIEKWVGLGQPAPRIPEQIPYTPRAKRALTLAAKEAKTLHRPQIGTEHIFLGLLLEGHGVAALVLRNLGVDPDKTRAEIRRTLAEG